MTGRAAALLLRIVGVVVLVASGAYLLVYLYRWEWNRALVSGLFFVAAEVALIGASILSRVNRLERRLEEGPQGSARAAPRAGGRDGPAPDDPGTHGRFAWLEPGGTAVFIPVLLGVGAILSGLAYVVERVAAASGSVAGDAAALRRIRRLAPPAGGLLADARTTSVGAGVVETVGFVPPPTPSSRIGRAVRLVATVVAAVVLITASVVVLESVTAYRPGVSPTTGWTTYDLDVRLRSGGHGEVWVAHGLWLSCRGELPSEASASFRSLDDLILLTVRPAVGPNDERRFVGCLEDAQLDRIWVDVVGAETWPDDDPSGDGPAV